MKNCTFKIEINESLKNLLVGGTGLEPATTSV